jgi:hypothetical protein
MNVDDLDPTQQAALLIKLQSDPKPTLGEFVAHLKGQDLLAAFANWYQLKSIEEPGDYPGAHDSDTWLDVFATFVRDLIEMPRGLAKALAIYDREPPPAPETNAHLIGCPECKSEMAGGPIQGYHTCAGDIGPPDWVHAPNLPGVEVHPENVSDIDRMLAPKDKP